MTTLGELLQSRRLPTAAMIAIRNTLHPDDVSEDFRDIDDIARINALDMYDRMQDGQRVADGTTVLSFAAMEGGRARLTGFRTFLMRAPGNVPGDIVYDYDAAHLLHSFIARAQTPIFYDAIEQSGLEDLIGKLVVQWREPLADHIRPATDAGLVTVAF